MIVDALKRFAVPITELIEDPRNARKHSKKNLAAIKASLKRFGQVKPIVIRKDKVVVAGNGRLKMARELGWKEMAAIVFTGSEKEARAYAIADNRSAELAEWNEKELALQLPTFEGFDLGFSQKEVERLMHQVELSEPLGAPKEKIIPVPKKPKTKVGGFFALGEHRLLCADSTVAKNMARLTAGSRPVAVVTDPPYGIGYKYRSHDDSSNDANSKLVEAVFGLLPYPKIWTPGLQNLKRDLDRFGKTKVVVWNKKFSAAGSGLGGASTWEPIFVIDPKTKHLENDVLTFPTDREDVGGESLRALHPCPKPVALFEHLLRSFTKKKDVVVDPFAGSGTVMIAAEGLGRRAFCVEMDPGYCDVIIQRWEQLTGKKVKEFK